MHIFVALDSFEFSTIVKFRELTRSLTDYVSGMNKEAALITTRGQKQGIANGLRSRLLNDSVISH